MKYFKYLMAGVLIVFTFQSCSKKKGCTDPLSISYDKDAEKNDGSCKYAGTGGGVTLVGFPQHHGVAIPNQTNYRDTIYIKFNVKDSPGNSPTNYDTFFVGTPGDADVHCTGLKPGYYYLFATGYDDAIKSRVTGGIPFSFTQESGEVKVNIPVSEP